MSGSAEDELAWMSAAELATAIRRRRLSPVEVVEAAIRRIEARNPSLNAFVFLGFEEARRAAKQAEEAVMAGAPLGLLHGVPTAIKDLGDHKAGWPATLGGIRALKDFVSPATSIFPRRLEAAGAIILGKTASPIMGLRGTCDSGLFGPTRNPFDTARNSGGSSGGSAAAVADGLVPLAQGGDGGGSIRIPASWCGVYGFKAGFGRMPNQSRPNAFVMDQPFIFKGPLTRSVEDAALTMQAVAGYDPMDPFALAGEVDYLGAVGRSIRGWKIAYSPDFDIFPVDPRVAAVAEAALEAFREAGATVEPVKVGLARSQQELAELWFKLVVPSNLQAMEQMRLAGYDLLGEHRADFPPEYLDWIAMGERMSALDLMRAQSLRTEVYDAVQSVFATHDLLVTPTLACLPVENADDGNTLGPREIEGEAVDPSIGWCMTYPMNYSGHPACSLPAGLAEGLPVGLQIVGRRYADGDVLAASAAFERHRPWRQSYAIPAGRPLD